MCIIISSLKNQKVPGEKAGIVAARKWDQGIRRVLLFFVISFLYCVSFELCKYILMINLNINLERDTNLALRV